MKSTIFYNTLKSIRVDDRFNAIADTFPNCNIARGYNNVQDCDLAIIQGWSKKKSQGGHNLLRKSVIKTQREKNKNVLTIDGNIFNYLSQGIYFRYSLNGIYANTGYYFDNTIDSNRWERIKSTIGFDLKSWRQEGEHILILLQKDSGWTMEEKSNILWCSETIDKIRKHTDRPIVIRMHPSDIKHKENYLMMARNKKVTLSENKNIVQDLKNAWCSISHNSSPGPVSVLEGVPVFITDNDWQKSPAAPVGNYDISKIEDPALPDRKSWIQKLAMSHFSIEDIKKGLLWESVNDYFIGVNKK
jgi:hypothetical protein|tara:strand:+ start:12960 stop:13865 length:906 start_codon:yes stop_codon:yes gene_type:complete